MKIVSKERLLHAMSSKGEVSLAQLELINNEYDSARRASDSVLLTMPSIGFLSVLKRMNAFYAVCRHLDSLIDEDVIDMSAAQLSLVLLRLSSVQFKKAIIMFDIRGPRTSARDRIEMPKVAREYLAGLELA